MEEAVGRGRDSVDDAVKAVPGVAETGDDVGVLVEPLVHPGGHHRDVRALADSSSVLPPSGAAMRHSAVTSRAPRSSR